ncbi:MAG TPA: 1-phosphofructokinase [Symbiobacteriaceae bacterium]|jgi:tagatose 6-phosphate kinase
MTNSILTVSLNAAVDVACIVDEFAVNKINTVHTVAKMAGGKANNVARVLASLGQPVIATGFAGGTPGMFIQEDLGRLGITAEYEPTAGDNRTCTTIVDPVGRTLTEIREKGPTLTPEDGERFLTRYSRLLDRVGLVVISGSLPPGVPADFYARLVRMAFRQTQVRVIVDASGRALAEVLKAQPYLVKPNREELEEWAGRPLPDDRAILAAARQLIESGPLVVAVSLGAGGLILVAPEGAWRATPPQIEPVNTVGSGDSLVAGFAAGLMQGLGAEDVLRLAVACGTANALTNEVAVVRPADLERIRSQVRVARIG